MVKLLVVFTTVELLKPAAETSVLCVKESHGWARASTLVVELKA